jgi:hypothetical protein
MTHHPRLPEQIADAGRFPPRRTRDERPAPSPSRRERDQERTDEYVEIPHMGSYPPGSRTEGHPKPVPPRCSAPTLTAPPSRHGGASSLGAFPHRAGHFAGLHPEDQPQQTYPARTANSVGWDADDEDSDEEEEEDRFALPTARLRPSAIRRVVPVRAGRSLLAGQDQERPRRRPHWMVRLGLALSLLLLSWLLLTEAATWTQHALDTLHYGYPRTYQTDAVVGHGDSPAHPSHFIAFNLDGHLEVIELAGGNPAHAHIYVGPTLTGPEAAQVPVTIAFQDVNGDGKPDLLLLFNGIQVIYLNTGTSFQPMHP